MLNISHHQDGDGDVRNLGKPVELAERYYVEGADEVTFLKYVHPRSLVLLQCDGMAGSDQNIWHIS